MDEKTQRILRQISSEIPKHLLDKIQIKKNAVKDRAIAMSEDGKASSKTKDKVRRMVESGIYDQFIDYEEDPETAKEIETFLAGRIRHLIGMGILKEPKEDPWMQKMRGKLQ